MILEVGLNKKYAMISQAVNATSGLSPKIVPLERRGFLL